MSEKKEIIIRTALSLFAQKGHQATSMQEIAEASGVAKGTLYTYFQSKDDLLLTIFKKYSQQFIDKLQMIENRTDLTEKEKFYEQVYTLLSEMMNVRDYIIVYFREQFIPNESTFQKFFIQTFHESLKWLKEKMIIVYGEKVRSHASDLAIFFHAIIKHFFFYPLCLSQSVTAKDVCNFAFHRLEDAIDGTILQEKPLTTDQDPFDSYDQWYVKSKPSILNILQTIKEKVLKLNLPPKKKDTVLQTVETIFREWKKVDPDQIILSGLFLYLKKEGPNEIKDDIEVLEQFLFKT